MVFSSDNSLALETHGPQKHADKVLGAMGDTLQKWYVAFAGI